MNFLPLVELYEKQIEHFKAFAHPIHTEKWQGAEIADRPEAEMMEVLFESFKTQIFTEDLSILADMIGPNLPWADDHFETERVSGQPLNPGQTWETWPWGHSADKFRVEGEQFNHSYAERYWPRHAGLTPGGILTDETDYPTHQGIRQPYGDLHDVVTLLEQEPLTRQAILPVYFPEDTGSKDGGRVPCSIAYHFMQRGGALHCSYWLRSCDLHRHFRDDVYLTVRLLLWILDALRDRDPGRWDDVLPGFLIMHIDSLHMFTNDYRRL